jgi:hypothetical protein
MLKLCPRWFALFSLALALLAGPLEAQQHDEVLLRAGAVVSNALPRRALAAGPMAGVDASFWLGSSWGLEGGISTIVYPLWTGHDLNLNCPDTGTLDGGGCGSEVLSPGHLLTASGALLVRTTPRTTLLLGMGRTRWMGPWHQPGNVHRSIWEYSAGVRITVHQSRVTRPAIELRTTRYERALGDVRWSFGTALVLRL